MMRLTGFHGFIASLETLTDKDAVWARFLKFAARHGFTHGGLADMPGPGEKLKDTILCLSWPEEWSKRYFQNNYIQNDPARLHLKSTIYPYSWNDMVSCASYTKAQKTIVFEASEFKLRSGMIYPMGDPRSGPAIVTIAGENPQMNPHEKIELHLAATYTHFLVKSLSRKHCQGSDQLQFSPREIECLKWNASGKTDSEIGQILSLSESTVCTYMQRIKQKFGVSTRKQAIVEALRSGVVGYG